MRYITLLCSLLFSALLQASGPVMVMYQVDLGDSWSSLAGRFQLSEHRLRWEFNRERFMAPLAAGDWIWVPDRPPLPAEVAGRTPAATSSPERMPQTATASVLPQLGPPDPDAAPKTDQLLLAIASAAKAAATDQLDQFVEQQTASFTDDTLLFGAQQLRTLPWLNPEDWEWDYQLPLFNKDPRLNSRMALPVTSQLHGELGLDYREERLTYQFGVHFRQRLSRHASVHVEPVFDYQPQPAHHRGGLLLFLSHPDWILGAGQYQAMSDWKPGLGGLERPASGQMWFGEGRLGFLPGLSVSSQQYQWQGRQLSLFGSGDKYKAAASRQWSINYVPWRIFRLQTSLLSNSKDKFESRVRLGIELPLLVSPGQWWQSPDHRPRYDRYHPLQHHKVMVLEHR
ncbi:inverse autotransporter beta domain-containing protein [Zobellella sp. DQSA1]|uniref:inverse autotransporter beta domain-containing protein n=1 Tax=Zobellella sp. DQSA1 TaxID=3342386 RepID=UPI0035C18ABC